jgi:dolichol kinase
VKHAGRKLWHVLGGLGLLGIWFGLGRPRAFFAYAGLLAGALAFDLARLARPGFDAWCHRRLGAFLRPGESGRLTGTPAYVAGVALALLLFPEPAAVAAVLFLAVGDVAATTVGERWGRRRVGAKSLEGTAAFFAAALLAGFVSRAALGGPAAGAVVAGAWSAALLELFMPRWANDNLVIPLAAALFMTLLGGAAP